MLEYVSDDWLKSAKSLAGLVNAQSCESKAGRSYPNALAMRLFYGLDTFTGSRESYWSALRYVNDNKT
jgi:hypothetical protein